MGKRYLPNFGVELNWYQKIVLWLFCRLMPPVKRKVRTYGKTFHKQAYTPEGFMSSMRYKKNKSGRREDIQVYQPGKEDRGINQEED